MDKCDCRIFCCRCRRCHHRYLPLRHTGVVSFERRVLPGTQEGHEGVHIFGKAFTGADRPWALLGSSFGIRTAVAAPNPVLALQGEVTDQKYEWFSCVSETRRRQTVSTWQKRIRGRVLIHAADVFAFKSRARSVWPTIFKHSMPPYEWSLVPAPCSSPAAPCVVASFHRVQFSSCGARGQQKSALRQPKGPKDRWEAKRSFS